MSFHFGVGHIQLVEELGLDELFDHKLPLENRSHRLLARDLRARHLCFFDDFESARHRFGVGANPSVIGGTHQELLFDELLEQSLYDVSGEKRLVLLYRAFDETVELAHGDGIPGDLHHDPLAPRNLARDAAREDDREEKGISHGPEASPARAQQVTDCGRPPAESRRYTFILE